MKTKHLIPLLLSLLLLLPCGVEAKRDITRFMGIPVTGTKAALTRKLAAKGFTPSQEESGLLLGEFNGRRVRVALTENSGKVWRVAVMFKSLGQEDDIRLLFNSLCRQFQNDRRYWAPGQKSFVLDSEEPIFEEMKKGKRYEAGFFQVPETAFSWKEVEEDPAARVVSLKKPVWFAICESCGEHFVTLFYDNEYNHLRTKDL